MDVAASLLLIAGSGGKLSTTLYAAATSSARTDKILTDIAGDVALTSNALTDVGRFLGDKRGSSVASQSAIKDANSILKRCHDAFEEIQELFGKEFSRNDGDIKLSSHGKLPWPLKGIRLELIKKRLESLKSSLVLLISVLNFRKNQSSGSRTEQTIQQQCQAIQQLYQRHRTALVDIGQLERKLERATLEDTSNPLSPEGRKMEFGSIPAHNPSQSNSVVTELCSTFAVMPAMPADPAQEEHPSTLSDIEILISRTKSFLASVELIANSLSSVDSNGVLLTTEARVKHHSLVLMNVLHNYLNTNDSITPPTNLNTSLLQSPQIQARTSKQRLTQPSPYYSSSKPEINANHEQISGKQPPKVKRRSKPSTTSRDSEIDSSIDGPNQFKNFDFDSFLRDTGEASDFNFILDKTNGASENNTSSPTQAAELSDVYNVEPTIDVFEPARKYPRTQGVRGGRGRGRGQGQGRALSLPRKEKKHVPPTRLVKACESCRRFKTKCDPGTPCQACVKRYGSEIKNNSCRPGLQTRNSDTEAPSSATDLLGKDISATHDRGQLVANLAVNKEKQDNHPSNDSEPDQDSFHISDNPEQSTGNALDEPLAMQHYHMQLSLLEQQNKRRLLMARQEQGYAMVVQQTTTGPSRANYNAYPVSPEQNNGKQKLIPLENEGEESQSTALGEAVEASIVEDWLFEASPVLKSHASDVVELLVARWTVDTTT